MIDVGTETRPAAVVVALNNVNGLGTVRALARNGIPVVAVVPRRKTPAGYTKYCSKVVCDDLFELDGLLELLIRIGDQLPARSVIFPSGDLYLTLLSQHRHSLEQYFRFPFPAHEIVQLITDKVRFYRFAIQHDLPISPTFFPTDSDHVREIALRIRYPCLIKPANATVRWRKRGLKILPAANESELLRQYETAVEIQPELVIQEVTPGPDSALYFSLTYVDRSGESPALFTGRKLRQNRPRYGISSMAQSLWVPEVADMTRSVLKTLNYTGYASIEFKKHPETGDYFMTEVTGRTWYPHSLSERCGINLPLMIYRDLVSGDAPSAPPHFEEGVKWVDEVGDFRSARQYWREKEISLVHWITSYRGKKMWALAARDDVRPVFALAGQLVGRVVRGVLRRLVRPLRKVVPSMN